MFFLAFGGGGEKEWYLSDAFGLTIASGARVISSAEHRHHRDFLLNESSPRLYRSKQKPPTLQLSSIYCGARETVPSSRSPPKCLCALHTGPVTRMSCARLRIVRATLNGRPSFVCHAPQRTTLCPAVHAATIRTAQSGCAITLRNRTAQSRCSQASYWSRTARRLRTERARKDLCSRHAMGTYHSQHRLSIRHWFVEKPKRSKPFHRHKRIAKSCSSLRFLAPRSSEACLLQLCTTHDKICKQLLNNPYLRD